MNDKNSYSIWIRPPQDMLTELQKDAARINSETNTPFPPAHINIYPGFSGTDDEVVKFTKKIVQNEKPFTLQYTTVDYSSTEYWVYFYLMVQPTPELIKLRRKAWHLGNKPIEPFLPHTSLMFGENIADETKEKYIPELEAKYSGKPITVNKLVIFKTQGDISSWSHVEDILFEY